MRILVARCEIAYHGRATTRLALGDRVILFKDDGSLCVHADRGYKPLNYMAGPISVTEDGDVIRVYRAASDETLVIVVHEVLTDERRELVDEAVLEHDGAERLAPALERAPGRSSRAGGAGAGAFHRHRPGSTCSAGTLRDARWWWRRSAPARWRARRAADPLLRASRPRPGACALPGILVAPEIARRRASCARPVDLASSGPTSACSRAEVAPELTLFGEPERGHGFRARSISSPWCSAQRPRAPRRRSARGPAAPSARGRSSLPSQTKMPCAPSAAATAVGVRPSTVNVTVGTRRSRSRVPY
jgi:hypothetical protein